MKTKNRNLFNGIKLLGALFCGSAVMASDATELNFKQSNGRFEVSAICHDTQDPFLVIFETDSLYFLVRRETEEDWPCYEGQMIDAAFPIESVQYTWRNPK